MTMFADYVDRLDNSTSTPLLGSLCWYTVAESLMIPHEDFALAAELVGLDRNIPNRPKDDDVFRRVCSNAQRKRQPVAGTTLFENIMVRDVKRENNHVWKQIVVETVDAGNMALNYTPVIELEYDPGTKSITTSWVGQDQHAGANVIAQEILAEFGKWQGMLHAYSIREFIRHVILDTNATVVRPSGGVYFTMTAKLAAIRSLETLVDTINASDWIPDGVLSIDTVPLIDDGKRKEMVRAAFENESVQEIDRLTAELKDLLDGPEITTNRYTAFLVKQAEIKERIAEYEELLDNDLATTNIRMAVLRSTLAELYSHTK